MGVKNTWDKDHQQFDLSYYYAGHYCCEPDHNWLGVRKYYLIHFVLSGKGQFHANDKTYDIGAGKAFIIYPNEYTAYKADHDDPWEYCWVSFLGDYAGSTLHRTAFRQKTRVIDFYDLNEDLVKFIHAILNVDTRNKNYHFVQLSHLMMILSHLETKSNESNLPYGPKHMHFKNAVDFIHKNYSQTITVRDIARYVCVDRKHLSHIFKTLANTSPQMYLIDTRLKHAAIMLIDSNLTINEIAYSVGYTDPLYFSKAFKKKYGLSPRDFRTRSTD